MTEDLNRVNQEESCKKYDDMRLLNNYTNISSNKSIPASCFEEVGRRTRTRRGGG